MDISGATVPVTVGSIEGAGTYLLGSNQLITGLNDLSTTVSGLITGTGGSLVASVNAPPAVVALLLRPTRSAQSPPRRLHQCLQLRVWPIIGPELATDGVVQPIARQMGLQTLGTLHQRIGDTLTLANTGGEGAGLARSDWARFFGQGIDNRYEARLPVLVPAAGWAAFKVASICGAAVSCPATAMPPASTWRLPTATSMPKKPGSPPLELLIVAALAELLPRVPPGSTVTGDTSEPVRLMAPSVMMVGPV